MIKLDSWNSDLVTLNDIFVNLSPDQNRARRYATFAGMSMGNINFGGAANELWFNILDEAIKQDKVEALIEQILKEYPNYKDLQRFKTAIPAGEAFELDAEVLVKDPKLVNALTHKLKLEQAPKASSDLEKILGESPNFMSMGWIHQMTEAAKSVCRIISPTGEGKDGAEGTGFLVEGGYLITNHHVIPNADFAATCILEFNFEEDFKGNIKKTFRYKLDPTDFITSIVNEFDFTRIKIKDQPEFPLSMWGSLEFEDFRIPQKDQWVSIIQHPNGEVKQIVIEDNKVLGTREQFVFYTTDTDGGSSGSPVFNRDWKVVALHHAGRKQGEGKDPYVINESGDKAYANKGILSKEILQDIKSKTG